MNVISLSVSNLMGLLFPVGDIYGSKDAELPFTKEAKAWEKAWANGERILQQEAEACLELNNVNIALKGRITLRRTQKALMVERLAIISNSGSLMKVEEWDKAQAALLLDSVLATQYNKAQLLVAKLHVFNATNGKRSLEAKAFSPETAMEAAISLLQPIQDWLATAAVWNRRRDDSIGTIKFPFPEYRTGQRQLAVDVYKALKYSKQLIGQAATGSGKTAAILFGAVKAMGEGHVDKIFYATAMNTCKAVPEKTLSFMRGQGLLLKSITLSAKQDVCLHPRQSCRSCSMARGYYNRVGVAIRQAFTETDSFDVPFIRTTARKHEVCPFEFSLDLSLLADIVICDYSYVYDPLRFLKRFFVQPSGKYAILCDEAHKLPDRVRSMLSASLNERVISNCRDWASRNAPQMCDSLQAIIDWLEEAEEKNGGASAKIPKSLPALINSIMVHYRKLPDDKKLPGEQGGLVDVYEECVRFSIFSKETGKSHALIYKKDEDGFSCDLRCLHPAEWLKTVHANFRASVFFSATLAPLHFHRHLLGLEETAGAQDFPTPFPPNQLKVLINCKILTYYRDREHTKTKVADMIATLVAASKGSYFAFFPSFDYLALVLQIFSSKYTVFNIVHQKHSMSRIEKQIFLNSLSIASDRSTVGFAVLGGSFSESIELAPGILKGVAVVGTGLPQINASNNLLKTFYDEKFSQGFEYTYMYPGMCKVLQATGRCIRSHEEKGAVMLIDTRYGRPEYKRLFPRHWHPQYIETTTELNRVLSEFWNNGHIGSGVHD